MRLMRVATTLPYVVTDPEWRWGEPWGDQLEVAGYMPEWEARAIIEACAELHASGVVPPHPAGTELSDGESREEKVQDFALMLVTDLIAYHGEEIATAHDQGNLHEVGRIVEEYRVAFRDRVEPRLHHIFEKAIENLDKQARGEQYLRWLEDEDAASKVARRWALSIRRAPPDEREPMKARARRWLTIWIAKDLFEKIWAMEFARDEVQ